MSDGKNVKWSGKTAGSTWMHRASVALMQYLPLQLVYAFVAIFVVPVAMIVNHKEYLAIYHFMRRRMNYGCVKAFWMTWLNHCRFSEIIIDRFYTYGGGRFNFDIPEYENYKKLARGESGFVILSAHVGNYEAAGYELIAETKRFNALVYAGESKTVMKNRERIFQGNNLHMILIQEDMSHLFEISNALDNGESVSISADRVFGSPRTVKVPFMGTTAELPLGPFAIAAQREIPVLGIHVVKTGTHNYAISIRRLEQGEGNIRQRAANIANQYASHLEEIVRQHPEQWFNYYEFFKEE